VSELIFREKVLPQDRDNVGRILAHTRFFTPEEQEIGISLVDEHLLKGESCGYLFLFAQEHETTLGYACYGPIPGTVNGYDLYWIAVDPSARHRGIGRLLLTETERRVIALGGERLYAETSSSSLYEPTRAFYERNGFFLEGRLTDYYAPADDKMLYVKRLLR
jgi:ribosomal protein S18 acetylase RimI-like enzyme